jgi:hypothetical protein
MRLAFILNKGALHMTMPTREEILSVDSDSEAMDMLRRIADALEGCVVVPKELTDAMDEAGCIAGASDRADADVIRMEEAWAAMLAAANKEDDNV